MTPVYNPTTVERDEKRCTRELVYYVILLALAMALFAIFVYLNYVNKQKFVR